MPWPQTGATHYHPQLGLPDKGCAIKELVVCYVVCLASIKDVGLAQSACVYSLFKVRMAVELKYHNTPIET